MRLPGWCASTSNTVCTTQSFTTYPQTLKLMATCMLTALLHFCRASLVTAGASSSPGGGKLLFLATVQAAERTPPPCGHLHRAGPQTYLSWGLTRQGWRGGWDLTRWARSSCDEPFFCLLSISPTKPGESGQQRRQPAANTSRMPMPNPQPRKVAVS